VRNYERLGRDGTRNWAQRTHARTPDMNNRCRVQLFCGSKRGPSEDGFCSHTILMSADVRASTKITHELLDRGIRSRSLFRLEFYEPVKRIIERYARGKFLSRAMPGCGNI